MNIIGYREQFAIEWEVQQNDLKGIPLGVQFVWICGKKLGLPNEIDYFTALSTIYPLLLSEKRILLKNQHVIEETIKNGETIWELPNLLRPINSSSCFDDFGLTVSSSEDKYYFYYQLFQNSKAYPSFEENELLISKVDKNQVEFVTKMFQIAQRMYSL